MRNGLLLPLLLLAGHLSLAQTVALPLTFETGTFTFTDFGGGVMTVIDNPNVSGINTTSKVARMVKNAGEVFGGSFIELSAPIDLSAGKIFKMKLFANRVGAKLLFKVENQTNGGIFFEQEKLTTVANAWEEMTFDFSAINALNTYQKLVFIYDLGTVGNGSADFTLLIDEITQTGGGGPQLNQIALPVTFEDSATDYTVVDFGGNFTEVVADPTNAANTVAKTVKGTGAELWAGTTIGTTAGFAANIPLSATETKMTVRVWSPNAGTPIRLKIEDRNDPTRSVETEDTTTVANGWQTLLFDFSKQVAGTAPINLSYTYNKASIFFNFGTTGAAAGEKTYYWDDVAFGGLSSLEDLLTMGLRYFPNPVSDRLNLSALRSIESLRVYSVTGAELIRMNPGSQAAEVDMSSLPAGVYLIKASVGGESGYFRVVKQ
jgi:hypothetical protein